MTPAEHYSKAEALLVDYHRIDAALVENQDTMNPLAIQGLLDNQVRRMQLAQVHATLATVDRRALTDTPGQ